MNSLARSILFVNTQKPLTSILLHDLLELGKALLNPDAKTDFHMRHLPLEFVNRFKTWRYGRIKPDVPKNIFDAIESVLRNRGGQVDGAQAYHIKREACSTTEFSYTLEVGRHPSAKPETIKTLETDFEEALYKVMGSVNVRVGFKPLRIVIDRNTDKKFLLKEVWQTIGLLEKNTSLCVPGYAITDDVSFYQLRLLDYVNVSVMAKSGFGKSQLLLSMLLTLCKLNSPEYLSLIIVDPKERDFPALEQLPHLACPIIYEYSEALQVLRKLMQELENRRKQRLSSYKPIVIVMDELADLVDALDKDERSELETIVKRIGQKGRSFGIILVGSSQRAYEVPEAIRNKLELKVAGRCSNNNDAYAATGISGLDLTKIARGEFELHPSNERLKGFFIADDKSDSYQRDIAYFVNDCAYAWVDAKPHYVVDGVAPQLSAEQATERTPDDFLAYCKSIGANGVKSIQQAHLDFFSVSIGVTKAQQYRDLLKGSDEEPEP